jgi:hypothetical protein
MIPNKVDAKCACFCWLYLQRGGKSDTYKICPKQASRNPGWHECRHETTIHKVLNAKNHQWNTKKEAPRFKCVIYGVVLSLKMGPLGGQSSAQDQSRATHCQNLGCTGPLTRMVWMGGESGYMKK